MAQSSVRGSRKENSSTHLNSLLTEFDFRRDPAAVRFLAEGIGILLAISLIFYQSVLAALVLSPLLFPIYRRCKRRRDEKRQKELAMEFKELLSSIMTSLKAGYSVENAFHDCYGDMQFLFGDNSLLCRELHRILHGLENHIPLEQLLLIFARDSGVDEIQEFAEVFAIAKRTGGNMTEILGRTTTLIQNRIEVENEIGVMISAKKLEQSIMDLVPFIIIVYIGVTSRGFFDVLYHNLAGILIMSACLGIYFIAFLISEKIMQIRV